MWVYSDKADYPQGGLVYQEVDGGHYQEFLNEKSAYIYYILEGNGKFVVEDQEYPVQATDVIMVPPGKRFFYLGNMKQILVTAPAWEESAERIIREIKQE